MKKARAKVKADINVTPLVDVVLVLLIIFMVVAPQLEAGVSVALPSIFNPDPGNAAMEPTTVTVTREGKLFFEKEPVELEALKEKLSKLHEQKPDTRLVLKADQSLGYGKVRTVFKACQDLGFPGVSLQVLDKANQKG
ncbi:MAG: biopolymer transporter ExbD [Myxococcaceae bacterium]|nr:biopolymer transporter ExbD [Myxococcaceae bacterium]